MITEKPKILVAEDDALFGETIRHLLDSQNYITVIAKDGQEARDFLKNDTFDLVLSDFKMPNMTGVELVEWIRGVYDRSFKNFTSLPIIMMTGFSNTADTHRVKQLGIQGLLSKPFDEKTLLSTLSEVLNVTLKARGQGIDVPQKIENTETTTAEEFSLPDYCRVSLEDFVTDRAVNMDVFVKLSESKYIKIANEGGLIDINRIENYKKKGLHYLYVARTDFKKVLDFNIMLSRVVATNKGVSAEKKKRFMTYTAEIILENSFVNGVDEQAFSDAKNFLMTSVDILSEDEETFSLLDILANHADHVFAHSVGVSMYSVMIAKQMGWTSSATLFKLSFGGLMHDIGKKEFPPELLSKPRSQLSYEERQQLETHAFRGKEILESLKSAPSEVVQIAFQHHENMIGHGFPLKLTGKKIHPMARVVSVANEFCRYALKGPNNPGVPAQKAAHLVESYKKDQLDPECLTALHALIKKTNSQ